MPTIYLTPGETLFVRFADAEGRPTDGEFTVEYTGTKILLRESAGLAGSIKGGAEEVLYHEEYIPTDDEVGEWVGEHYAKHFPSLDRETQDDYRQRYLNRE